MATKPRTDRPLVPGCSPATSRAALTAHIECHFANGRTDFFIGMAQCPLYIKQTAVSADATERTVDLTVEGADALAELRRRAATHASVR